MGEAEPTPVQVYNCPFRLPPELELTTGNVSENFKKWKRQVEVYLAASGGTEKAKEVQVAIILSCGGPHVVEIYDQFQWDDGNDKNDPDKLVLIVTPDQMKYSNHTDFGSSHTKIHLIVFSQI